MGRAGRAAVGLWSRRGAAGLRPCRGLPPAGPLAAKHRRDALRTRSTAEMRATRSGCYTPTTTLALPSSAGGDKGATTPDPSCFLPSSGKAFQVLDVDAGHRGAAIRLDHRRTIRTPSGAPRSWHRPPHGELLLGLGELAFSNLRRFIDPLEQDGSAGSLD